MIDIKNCYNYTIFSSANATTLKEALEEAVKAKVNLSGAKLSEANLSGAKNIPI